MKKQGDLKRDNSFLSVSEMLGNVADNISIEGDRMKCFLNFKPTPVTLGIPSYTETNCEGFWKSKRRTKALIGGLRSGKSYNSCIEALIVYTGIIPYALRGIYAYEDILNKLKSGTAKRPRRVRIIVMDYTNHFPTVIRPMLLGNPLQGDTGYLPEGWDNWDEDEHIFYGQDGSFLHIYSADPKEVDSARKARGGQFDHTWIDEPNSNDIYTESLGRALSMKDGQGTVTLSYCPQDGFKAWHYEDIYKANYNATTYRPKPILQQNKSIFVQVITPMDNPFNSPEKIEDMRASCRPWEIDSKLLGRYSHRGNEPCFNMEVLARWEKNYQDMGVYVSMSPKEVDMENGIFEGSMEMVEHNDAVTEINNNRPVWKIWKQPEDGHKYIMTADNSLGFRHSDFNVADIYDVVDMAKPVQVAQLHIREIRGTDFSIQCAMMATFFGECLIAPESNCGEVFIDTLRNYPNFYTRRQPSSNLEEKEQSKYGFSTNKYSKANIIENMHQLILEYGKEDYCPFNSFQTLSELESYQEKIITSENRSVKVWGAKTGENDDCCITAMIALWIMKKEYEKITVCKLKEYGTQSLSVNRHGRVDDKINIEKTSFANYKNHRKPSLYSLSQKKAGESCSQLVRKRKS